MRDFFGNRETELARYIIETGATVRAAAKVFGVSKSTVHTVVTITNDLCGWWHKHPKTA